MLFLFSSTRTSFSPPWIEVCGLFAQSRKRFPLLFFFTFSFAVKAVPFLREQVRWHGGFASDSANFHVLFDARRRFFSASSGVFLSVHVSYFIFFGTSSSRLSLKGNQPGKSPVKHTHTYTKKIVKWSDVIKSANHIGEDKNGLKRA